MPYCQYLPSWIPFENSRNMGDFGYKVKVAAEKAKDKAWKAKRVICKNGGKAVGACKNGWAKLKKSIKGKNRRVEYLGGRH